MESVLLLPALPLASFTPSTTAVGGNVFLTAAKCRASAKCRPS